MAERNPLLLFALPEPAARGGWAQEAAALAPAGHVPASGCALALLIDPQALSGDALQAALASAIEQLHALLPQLSDSTAPAGIHGIPLAAPVRQTATVPRIAAQPSRRQFEVLGLLSQGWSNKRIARQLGISERTVKLHVSGLLERLDASNRTHLLVRAREQGLL